METTPKKNEKPSAQDLHHAILKVKALVFNDEYAYDELGYIRDEHHVTSFILDDEDPELIASLTKEIEHLRKLVYRDELTGALNRRGLRDEIEDFINEALYSKDHPGARKGVTIADVSAIFLDLDNFKSINDTYGHDEGDRVLKDISHTLHTHVRGLDAIARLGGEEFLIILLGADEHAAFEKAEEVRQALSAEVLVGGERPVTASIGVASLHHSQAKTLEELITFADKAMYEAKANRGKNATARWSEIAS